MDDGANTPEPTAAAVVAAPAVPPTAASDSSRVHYHLCFGWIGLLAFVLLGIALEALHAWKSPLYLGVGNETRRLMWTLAHAHGVGLSLVHLGFAATLGLVTAAARTGLLLASRLLSWASVLIPLGFFLGGTVTYEADPGIGVILVPFGALALVSGLARVVWVLVTAARKHG
jgi:hypothetical protein